MAVWLPASNRFYLPPQPITRVQSTEEYVSRTNIFYHAATERLLTVGNPFFAVKNQQDEVTVPKVSANQYRSFRIKLPDPNNFAFGDKHIFDPEHERLVWGLRGIEVERGQPLGIGISGHPLFNRLNDAENPYKYENSQGKSQDLRDDIAFDPKQVQMLMVGCKPQLGEYWGRAEPCNALAAGDCPPIELKNVTIQDGDMIDMGFGAMDFADLQSNKSDVPLELVDTKSIYPDFIKMLEEAFGDSLFFFSRREQLYARHTYIMDGTIGEKIPDTLMKISDQTDKPPATDIYGLTPSGSLNSSESQLFNRPYWLQKAQGQNNGILWRNQIFVTTADNTRGTNFNINQDTETTDKWDPSKNKEYKRHVEEFQIAVILQLCKVRLTPENLAFIHTMDPDIIEDWHLAVTQPGSALHDYYRYITSMATKCPADVAPTTKPDPYADMRFWEVDLKDRLTEQLDQTPLGRKFLFQTGLSSKDLGKSVVVARPRAPTLRKRKRKLSKSS